MARRIHLDGLNKTSGASARDTDDPGTAIKTDCGCAPRMHDLHVDAEKKMEAAEKEEDIWKGL